MLVHLSKRTCAALASPSENTRFVLMYFNDDVLAVDGCWEFSSGNPKTQNN